MVGVIGDSELTIITLLGLARDVKTFTEVEKDLGISVCTLDKSKTFLGIVNCSLFTSLIRNLEGFVQEFNLSCTWVLITPINSNDKLNPIPMLEGEIPNLIS